MIYLLDTNAWISYLNRRTSKIAQRLAATDPADVRLCSVVLAELLYGAYKSNRVPANLLLLERLSKHYMSVPFDDAAAHHYGQVRAVLASGGIPIGPLDLMIAAIALSNTFMLVTHNTGEFRRVPGLGIEDWEA